MKLEWTSLASDIVGPLVGIPHNGVLVTFFSRGRRKRRRGHKSKVKEMYRNSKVAFKSPVLSPRVFRVSPAIGT